MPPLTSCQLHKLKELESLNYSNGALKSLSGLEALHELKPLGHWFKVPEITCRSRRGALAEGIVVKLYVKPGRYQRHHGPQEPRQADDTRMQPSEGLDTPIGTPQLTIS